MPPGKVLCFKTGWRTGFPQSPPTGLELETLDNKDVGSSRNSIKNIKLSGHHKKYKNIKHTKRVHKTNNTKQNIVEEEDTLNIFTANANGLKKKVES